MLPVEAWTNSRHGTVYAVAYDDQVMFVAPNGTFIEFQLCVFEEMTLRLLMAAHSSPLVDDIQPP